jgi:NitT/TauT family transport system substrate-binding protein
VRLQRRAVLSLVLALAMIAAACGDDDNGDEEAAPDEDGVDDVVDDEPPAEPVPVTVGTVPLTDLAPLFYGIEQGFFEEEGLDVTVEPAEGGAALVPAITSGDYEFAIGNYISVMIAREQGLELQIVAPLATGPDSPDQGTYGLLVDPESGIESIDDLAGRSFAVNAVENINDVTVRTILEENGVDDSDISFIEVPFPAINDTVASGDADVAWSAEPFIGQGLGMGLVSIADPIYETIPSMPIGGAFASESWLEENPELANGFYRAMQRSLEAASDEDAMREALAGIEFMPIPEEAIPQISLGNWQPELDLDALAEVGELTARYGIIEEEPNLDELVWTPSE